MTSWSNTWNMSFNPDKYHILTTSLRKDRLANPPIYFLNNPLEVVQSFKFLGLTISHDLSVANNILKLASKASCRMDIFHHTKSFLGTPELLSIYKAFISNLVEDTSTFISSSPLWAGSPASHLAQLDAVETKAIKIIGISYDEAESMGLSLCHRRQVGSLSVLFHLLSGLAPSQTHTLPLW